MELDYCADCVHVVTQNTHLYCNRVSEYCIRIKDGDCKKLEKEKDFRDQINHILSTLKERDIQYPLKERSESGVLRKKEITQEQEAKEKCPLCSTPANRITAKEGGYFSIDFKVDGSYELIAYNIEESFKLDTKYCPLCGRELAKNH